MLDSAKVGIAQKKLRRESGVTLNEVSQIMEISIGYLSDLENARPGKPWNLDLIRRHTQAVNAAKRHKQKAK